MWRYCAIKAVVTHLSFPESEWRGKIHSAMKALIPIIIGLLVGSSSSANAVVKPNIVFILADDLGWADVGYHGGYIKTPNIDRLAREGVELDRFYVAPMCSPTRAGLLTGRYPIRFGLARAVIPPWRNFGLDTGEVTLADVMGKAGYAHRGVFGKWHLGHHDPKWHPLARGFTHFHGHYNGAIDYFTHEREGERDWHVNYEPSDEQGYSTDLIADGAANFIKEHSKDGPYFCYVPFNAPHSPFQVPAKYLQQYAHLGNAKTANAKGGRKIAGNRKQILAAMTACMDEGIGRILKAIEESGKAKNTIVWFSSDNGGIGAVKENNLPLRGNKLDVFEGGVRVPACVRWPAGLKGGRKVTVPLSHIDVLPTLMHISGVEEHADKPLDGKNVLPILTGKQKRLDRNLYSYHGQAGAHVEEIAIRSPEWKLIVLGPDISKGEWRTPKHKVHLIAIDKDPFEKTNLISKHPQVAKQLAEKLIAFRRLQPKGGVPVYQGGRQGFAPPKAWRLPPQD